MGGPTIAWEERPTGWLYYRSERRGDRVIKRYVGRGEVARIAAEIDREVRAGRAAEARELREGEARLAPLEGDMRALDRSCALLIEATLTAAGFHRPYGSWRRRRARRG